MISPKTLVVLETDLLLYLILMLILLKFLVLNSRQ
jgi:hypothetical protein